uniref:DUF3143 domain-containing protein n=1 Tax=Trichocoleus desertorum TaxID=1481672 RepID=UPI0025B49022|nr:DUF3143 domain-containing protein [Trichocoleus desertorum]
MPLPSSDTPLYNHSLPDIETWLTEQGCEQDPAELHCWRLARPAWKAELCLDVDQLTVRYLTEGEEIQRSFKYLLSRQDIEDAVFSGP